MRTMLLLKFYICISEMYFEFKAYFDLVLNLSLIGRITTKLYEEMKRRRGLFWPKGKIIEYFRSYRQNLVELYRNRKTRVNSIL